MAQSKTTGIQADSLQIAIKKAPKDSILANNLLYLASYYFQKNLTKSTQFSEEAFQVSRKENYIRGLGQSSYWLGKTDHKKGKLNSAIKHLQNSIEFFKAINQRYFEAKAYAELGNVYNELGDMVSAIENHQKAIDLFKEIDNKTGIGVSYSDLGNIHLAHNNPKMANSYLKQAEAIFKAQNDESAIAQLYNRRSSIARTQGNFNQSLDFDFQALMIQEKLRDQSGMAHSNYNIGKTYLLIQNIDRAKGYASHAQKLYDTTQDLLGSASCHLLLAEIAIQEKSKQTAIQELDYAIQTATQIGALIQLSEAYEVLAKLYEIDGKYDKAYLYLSLQNAIKDTIFSVERTKQFSELEFKYQNKKIDQAYQEAKKESQQQSTKANTFIISFFLGCGILSLFLTVLYKRHKISRKVNQNLERKNRLIEKKNNEILDSILYAKRIQEAMLTSRKYIDDIFADNFILYRPKDIISGDFYWAHNSVEQESVYWATADCTGHGVPGALMSMIGTVLLNEAVVVQKESSTSTILMNLNIFLRRYLNKSDSLSPTQDGMEIALCKFNKATMELEFSGANHNVYIVRGGDLLELKGTKATLGMDPFGRDVSLFEQHRIQLLRGDIIYTFTDGYSDQIGGPDKRKFKLGALKDLIKSVYNLPLKDQREAFKRALKIWQEDYPQIDDILIMAVKIED